MFTDRRRVLTLLAASFATPVFAQAPAMTRITAYAFSFSGLGGADIKLADHVGKPILVVNTASFCGYTPQYAGLQQLWARYHERGSMIDHRVPDLAMAVIPGVARPDDLTSEAGDLRRDGHRGLLGSVVVRRVRYDGTGQGDSSERPRRGRYWPLDCRAVRPRWIPMLTARGQRS